MIALPIKLNQGMTMAHTWGGIQWAREHKAHCSKKGCAECSTAEDLIKEAVRLEDEVQIRIAKDSKSQLTQVVPPATAPSKPPKVL